jgi:transposase
MQVTTIGLDLAKHWFQVHGVDASGAVALRRKLRRSEVLNFFQSLPPCLATVPGVGIMGASASPQLSRIPRCSDQLGSSPPGWA